MKASDLTYYISNIRREVDRLPAFISTGPSTEGDGRCARWRSIITWERRMWCGRTCCQ